MESFFYNLPTAFLNITPKHDMLQVSFVAKAFQSLCLKKDKFYICILWITNKYNTLKSHKKDAHTGHIILTLKLQENSSGYHSDLVISKLNYNISV